MLIAERDAMMAKSSLLPPGARWVEYIESTGEQYIDTGVYGSMSLDFVADFTPTEISSSYGSGSGRGSIFGSRTSWERDAYQLSTYNISQDHLSGHFLCSHNYGWNNPKAADLYAGMVANEHCIIRKDGLIFTRADGTTTTLINQTFQTQLPILAFAIYNGNNVIELSKIRFHALQFALADALLRDLIPVRFKNENSVIEGAMYDKLGVGGMNPDGTARNDGLYRNRGTGAFIIGPDKAFQSGGHNLICPPCATSRSWRHSAQYKYAPRTSLWKEAA